MKVLNRLCVWALALVASVVFGGAAQAQTTTPTVSDVITSAGVVSNMTAASTALATVFGTCLIVWFAFRLFYKGRKAAGRAVG